MPVIHISHVMSKCMSEHSYEIAMTATCTVHGAEMISIKMENSV